MSVIKDWPDEPEEELVQDPRYEDHCWLHVGGRDVRIIAASWPRLLVQDTHGVDGLIDLSGLDMDKYCRKAVELLRWMWTF